MKGTTARRSPWAAPLLAALAFFVAGAAEARAVPVVAVTDTNRLVLFESSAPGSILASVNITGLQMGETILGIDFRPATGQLFAVGSTGRLYVVNPSTGAATLQAVLVADPTDPSDPFTALSGTSFGVDFNPSVDRLRVVSDADQNLRINPNNGQTITDGTLVFAAGDTNAGQNPNVGGAAYINNVAAAATTTLYDIDTGRDVLVTQNPPNNGVLNTVGSLGVDVGVLLGFDVAPGAAPQTAFAAMRAASGLGSSGFYTINLSTGAATLVGNIGGGEFIRGIAVMPVSPNIYAVTVTNRLLLFNSSAPGTILNSVQITGLSPGDNNIAGIDFRPATGQLYAFSAEGRTYTINPQTGVATFVGSPGGVFSLTGQWFGVDFNPVPDRLRVVSNSDENLRINPNNGALAGQDTPLAYHPSDPNSAANPNIVGAAYTNSFAGATSTTLYDIDSNLDILVRQGGDPGNGIAGDPGNPNSGRLFTVGALGVDATNEVGFDIAPGSNRAFAALNPASVPFPRLYVVNLRASTNVAAGSTILLGEIGGGEIIRDIAVAPQGTFQFSAQSFSVTEDCTSVEITVTRTGDLTQPASVDYFTTNGTATDRADYNAAVGTVSFNSGESSKTFRVLINEDSHDEKAGGTQQGETFNVNLRNATGGFFLGTGATASVLIIDDAVEPATNAIDDTTTFVCQHYHDFLNRDPDPPGIGFWTSQINSCNGEPSCVERQRVLVSAAFFLSIEFQQTGFLVNNTYAAAFGPTRIGGTVPLTLQEFLPDVQRIGRGVIVGQGDWQAQLEANKVAYFNEFVTRPAFLADYPASFDNTQFVNQLGDRSGALSPAERASLINELDNGRTTRAAVLRRVAEDTDLVASQFNRAFVLMQYFGYLRRNPNDPPDADFGGYNFWLAKLNQFNGDFIQAEMVRAFLSSIEYRQRFGQ